jgi:hypothetical protein
MMRLIVSRSTKKTELQDLSGDPAGDLLARRGRPAPGASSFARRTSSIISNRPGMLVLGTLLVVAMSSTLILSNADVSRRPGDLSLHEGASVSKFKNVQGGGLEAHLRSLVRNVETSGANVAQKLLHPTVPTLSPNSLRRVPERRPTDSPFMLTSFQPEQVMHRLMDDPYYLIDIPRDEHPGVGPMIKDWKTISSYALLAGAIMQGSAAAAFQDPPNDTEKLDNIQKELKSLNKKIETANAEMSKTLTDFQAVRSGIRDDLKQMSEKLTDVTLMQQKTQERVDFLGGDVAKLRTEVESLRNRVQISTDRSSTALYGPSETASNPASMGQIEMINNYANPVTVVVNRRGYTLNPNETRKSDPIPAGTFTYEVLGITDQTVRSVGPNQIFTVRVYNR